MKISPSYEVVLDEASGDAVPGLALDRVDANGITVVQSSILTGTGTARSLRWQNTGTSVVDQQTIRVGSPACGSTCGTDDTYRLRAYETTGRIPRFNNTATQVTVVILQNTSAQPIDGRLYFWGPTGASLGSVPFSVVQRGTHVLDTRSVAGLQGQSGSLTVTHNGRVGWLDGKAGGLEPATGFSFDSPMTTRTR